MTTRYFSDYYIPTRKETPQEAEIPSHQLMIRAGMIRRLHSGIYSFLPLAQRVLHKIETVVRQEMNKAGGMEIRMPIMQPRDLWERTGRWDVYGPEMLRLEDRQDREYGLGPTHEEVVTDLLSDELTSYRDCPVLVYQIATKFRDEIRPRFGVMRSREFVMKDAYSFDASEAQAEQTYDQMDQAYRNMFDRMGLDFRRVKAATGAIGGSLSHEFMVPADTGEDVILQCENCDYAANQEQAEGQASHPDSTGPELDQPEPFETPGVETIGGLTEIDSEATPERQIKTMVYRVNGTPTALLIPGNDDLNEVKLSQHAGGSVEQMTPGEINQIIGAHPGSLGAVDLDESVQVWADHALRGRSGCFTGANRDGYHLRGVDVDRDIEVDSWKPLRVVGAGDSCPECDGNLIQQRGIEVGHIFYLGTKYSKQLQAEVKHDDGKSRPVNMGCYGIGVTRIIAAAIEQSHDDQGIIWPAPIAPFHVYILLTSPGDTEQVEAAESMAQTFEQAGLDVIIDDRDDHVGVKFNDSELIGIPHRITVGRDLSDGKVEWTVRGDDTEVLPVNDCEASVIDALKPEAPV